MYLDVLRGGDAQTYLVSADFQHCNYHVMADHDALMNVPRQYQQSSLLPWAMVESLAAGPRAGDHGRGGSFTSFTKRAAGEGPLAVRGAACSGPRLSVWQQRTDLRGRRQIDDLNEMTKYGRRRE
jgi:hypothetical protein